MLYEVFTVFLKLSSGFSKAMNDNVLIQYLAKDLQKASINPSFLSVDKNGQVSIQIPSTTSR
jgi:hypothetical protein